MHSLKKEVLPCEGWARKDRHLDASRLSPPTPAEVAKVASARHGTPACFVRMEAWIVRGSAVYSFHLLLK